MGISSPPLSIGLPVFNGEKYLEESLCSLLGQKYADFELIITDNASNDRTEEICKYYARKDSRIHYFRGEKNLGAAVNWYYALDLSQGKYFKWAAHDDIYEPDFLGCCIDLLEDDPLVVSSYTKTKVIDENGSFVRFIDVDIDTTSPRPNKRLYNIIKIDYLCIQMYGVFRSKYLKTVYRYKGYIGWDRNVLAEISLMGLIRQYPEYLFLHRLYPEAWGAEITSRSPIKDKRLYDPSINWHRNFSPYHRYKNYFNAVARIPLDPSERMSCYLQLIRLIIEKFLNRLHLYSLVDKKN